MWPGKIIVSADRFCLPISHCGYMNLNITLKRSDARSLRSQGALGVWRGSAGACPTKLFLTFGVFPVGILILSANLLQAQLIDVDFNNNSYGADAGGPDPGPTMSGAAVLGLAGDQWNGIDVNNGTGIPLIYANGNNSPVTMTFTSGGGYDVNSYERFDSFCRHALRCSDGGLSL